MDRNVRPLEAQSQAHPSAASSSLYQQSRARIAKGDLKGGAQLWHKAVAIADQESDPVRAAWLQARLAQALAGAGQWPKADTVFEAAVRRLNHRSMVAAQLLRDEDWIEALLQHNLWDDAERRLRRALLLDPEESLDTAWDLTLLGSIAKGRGDYDTVRKLLGKAYAIQQKLAPGSAWMIQREQARVAFRQGDLEAEEKILLKEFQAQERIAPEGLGFAAILSDLGKNASAKGDLTTAEERLQRAFALIGQLSPGSLDFACTLALLGQVDLDRGDLASAEARLRQALVLLEKLAPQSFYVAYFSNELAFSVLQRGDLAEAEERFRSSPSYQRETRAELLLTIPIITFTTC